MLATGIALLASGPWAAHALSECGDGTTQPGEQCDDANSVIGDGCDPSCLFEICGNGVLTPGTEACDDGNTTPGDGCAADCSCETEVCGDGIKGCLEECDDGNTVDGDDCGRFCVLDDFCEPLTKAQLACIRAINKNLAGVIKAQNADDANCVADVAGGKHASTAGCFGGDLKGSVTEAQVRTFRTATTKCNDVDELPPLAYTDPMTVNAAGIGEPLEAAEIVLGETPSIVLKSDDRTGAACQAEAMKQLGAVANRWAAEANKAKSRALKGDTGNPLSPAPPACSNIEVAVGIDAGVAASTSLGRAETRATAGITRKCTTSQVMAGLFDCYGATTTAELAACVIAAAEEAACNAFEVADGLALDCPAVPGAP